MSDSEIDDSRMSDSRDSMGLGDGSGRGRSRRGGRDDSRRHVGNDTTMTTNTTTMSMETGRIEDVDEDTIRIILSTDNHLGFVENDAVRGSDSFAALEEVLYLAKHYGADMVLLTGDLFHENKPSRNTMHKTMDIFRRYCMGPNPVPIQILSDQAQNFRRGLVNYEDENYSVDLPVFAIHGNHDDPTREGGNSGLYAALDLLDVANLVNYVGPQDDVNQIQIEPILMKKGQTHLALYGLGSMRDERLNRMWRSQKLTFLRPEAPPSGVDNDTSTDSATPANNRSKSDPGTPQWFNIFALHQNRESGRGSKNFIHESMIPEWIDLVCWGHEHECCIEPQESVVGTFRITQPGSSVATSLTAGEARRKQFGILDINRQQFRLEPIPLTQVRSFVMNDLSLSQREDLNPDEAKVEQKMTSIMEEEVRVLVHDAKELRQDLLEAANKAGNILACQLDNSPLKHNLQNPDQVLVRLRVEHSGFTTVNNQRFGAKFIGEVANPTDILLFHRRKVMGSSSSAGKVGSSKLKGIGPIAPDGLEEMNIEDLIAGELESSDRRLELFTDKKIAHALDDYVKKQQAQAIPDMVQKLLKSHQKERIERKEDDGGEADKGDGGEGDESKMNDDDDDEVMDAHDNDDDDAYNDDDDPPSPPQRKRRGATQNTATTATTGRNRKRPAAAVSSPATDLANSSDDDGGGGGGPKRRGARSTTAQKTTTTRTRGRKTTTANNDSDDEIEVVSKPPPKPRGRRAATAATASRYADESSDDMDANTATRSARATRGRAANGTAASTARKPAAKRKAPYNDHQGDSDSDDEIEVVSKPTPAPRRGRRGAATAATPQSTSTASSPNNQSRLSQSQLSFQPARKGAAAAAAATTRSTTKRTTTTTSRRAIPSNRKAAERSQKYIEIDSDDDDDNDASNSNWGSVRTNTTFGS